MLLWALGWVIGFETGRRGNTLQGGGCSSVVMRIAQAAPIAAVALAHPMSGPLGCLAGYAGGRAVARRQARLLDERAAVLAPGPLRPSRRIRWTDKALLRVVGWPSSREDRWRAPAVLVRARREEADAGGGPEPGQGILLAGRGRKPSPGDLLAGRLTSFVPRRAAHEGGFDPAAFYVGRGLPWTGDLEQGQHPLETSAWELQSTGRRLTAFSASIESTLARRYPPPESALLRSVLLGRRDALEHVPRDVLTELGLGHVFAVSGLHVGILAAIVVMILGVAGVGPAPRLVVLACVLSAYVVVTGMAASTLRAAAMGVLAAMARPCGRQVQSAYGLALVFWMTQVWWPDSIADIGLRLSFLAVSGILVAVRLTPRPPSKPLRWLLAGLGVSGGAVLATAPVAATTFGRIPPWSPVINLLGLPLFGAGVWLGVFSLLTAPITWVSEAIAAWSWLLLRGFAAAGVLLHSWLPTVSAAPSWTPWRLLLWATAILGTCRVRGCLRLASLALCIGTVFVPWPEPSRMEALQADVGQGDCAVLVFPDHSAVLIDTGERWRSGSSPLARDVLPWLHRKGVKKLAGVVLTHDHADHVGAVAVLADALPVERWWLGGRCTSPPAVDATRSTRPIPGEVLHQVGPWSLVCYANADSLRFENENDRSLVVGLLHGDRLRGLWTGDREVAGEMELLESLPPEYDLVGGVLKAGHHGSTTSTTRRLLDRLRPSWIILSCGVENRHHHPSHPGFETRGQTPEILRTDFLGGITMAWDKRGELSIAGRRRDWRLETPPP